jgi:hypothetical protein
VVINESLRVLDCRVVIGAFETVAFHKVTVEPNGIRAVFRRGVYLPVVQSNYLVGLNLQEQR